MESCILAAVEASSTDNYPLEGIEKTLEPQARWPDPFTPSYWSSKGQQDPAVPEALVYRLRTPLCLVRRCLHTHAGHSISAAVVSGGLLASGLDEGCLDWKAAFSYQCSDSAPSFLCSTCEEASAQVRQVSNCLGPSGARGLGIRVALAGRAFDVLPFCPCSVYMQVTEFAVRPFKGKHHLLLILGQPCPPAETWSTVGSWALLVGGGA